MLKKHAKKKYIKKKKLNNLFLCEYKKIICRTFK